MKTKITVVLSLFLALTFQIKSQNISDLERKKSSIISFNFPREEVGNKNVIVPVEFGKSILDKDLEFLKDKTIEKITYVYSHCRNTKFQQKLNKKRINSFLKKYPYIVKNKMTGWEFKEQKSDLSKKETKKLFHGFIISYRESSKKILRKEIGLISEILEKGALIPEIKISTVSAGESVKIEVSDVKVRTETSPEKKVWDDSLRVTMVEVKEKLDSIMLSSNYALYRKYSNKTDSTTIYILEKSYFSYYNPDSTVYKVLVRNKKWKNNLIIHDITGSMSPYTAQVLLWHKLNYDKNNRQHFVFFNDGDLTPDSKKITGKVGGLYQVANSEGINVILKQTQKAMRNGSGGDCPENNMEAVLAGLKSYPEAENIIMIADNFATPRDLSLANKVKKPIKIILCGVYGILNVEYLNLAKETKGSIHTIESDIYNLMDIKEGKTITIDKKKYKLVKGKFVLVN